MGSGEQNCVMHESNSSAEIPMSEAIACGVRSMQPWRSVIASNASHTPVCGHLPWSVPSKIDLNTGVYPAICRSYTFGVVMAIGVTVMVALLTW